jgi:hypothetical protein
MIEAASKLRAMEIVPSLVELIGAPSLSRSCAGLSPVAFEG